MLLDYCKRWSLPYEKHRKTLFPRPTKQFYTQFPIRVLRVETSLFCHHQPETPCIQMGDVETKFEVYLLRAPFIPPLICTEINTGQLKQRTSVRWQTGREKRYRNRWAQGVAVEETNRKRYKGVERPVFRQATKEKGFNDRVVNCANKLHVKFQPPFAFDHALSHALGLKTWRVFEIFAFFLQIYIYLFRKYSN